MVSEYVEIAVTLWHDPNEFFIRMAHSRSQIGKCSVGSSGASHLACIGPDSLLIVVSGCPSHALETDVQMAVKGCGRELLHSAALYI